MTAAAPPRPRPLGRALAVLLVLLVLAAAGAVFTLWPLVAVVGVISALALGQVMRFALALATAFGALLAASMVVLRITAATGVPIGIGVPVALALIGAAALVVLVRCQSTAGLRFPSRRGWTDAAIAGGVPVVVLLAAGAIAVLSGGSRLAWAMQGDAVSNTMLARFIWSDGGIDSGAHPNAATLTQSLMVSIWAPGRDRLDPAALLGHDVGRSAELLVVFIAIAAGIASAVAVVATAGRSTGIRVVAAILAGIVPLTAYVAGTSILFGFFNGPLILALLLAVWLVWLAGRDDPDGALVALSMLTIAILGGWAPLAVVPVAVAAGVIVLGRRRLLRRGIDAPRALLVVALLALIAYGLLVVVPDFLSTGSGLANDGGMAPMSPWAIIVMGAIAVLATAVEWRWARRRRPLVGVVAIGAAGAVAIAYLVWQRRGLEVLWGYYPEKFAWFLGALLVVVVIGSLLSLPQPERIPVRPAQAPGARFDRVLLPAATAVIAVAMLVQLPPSLTTVGVMLSVVDPRPGVAAGDQGAVDAATIAVDGERRLVSGWGEHDRFVNSWLIQTSVDDQDDPIRMSAYYLDPDDLAQVCEAITIWGGDVTVYTRDASLEDRLSAVCDESMFAVVVDSAQSPSALPRLTTSTTPIQSTLPPGGAHDSGSSSAPHVPSMPDA